MKTATAPRPSRRPTTAERSRDLLQEARTLVRRLQTGTAFRLEDDSSALRSTPIDSGGSGSRPGGHSDPTATAAERKRPSFDEKAYAAAAYDLLEAARRLADMDKRVEDMGAVRHGECWVCLQGDRKRILDSTGMCTNCVKVWGRFQRANADADYEAWRRNRASAARVNAKQLAEAGRLRSIRKAR